MRLTFLRALALSTALALPATLLPPAAPALAQPADAPHSFADLAAKLLPAVVNISSTTEVRADSQAPGEDLPFPPGSPFDKFFHDFMNRNRPGGKSGPDTQQEPARKMQSLGSGFIIDPSGLIVTNNHVIEGADEITVTLQDNTTLKAKLLGTDKRTDIAVLQVTPDKGVTLHAVSFGNSDKSRIGDWVLAIGNPFGLGGTVTAGIVSARGRDIHQGPYDDFIQTDAPINRGNSGGPLFNMNGDVVGINTAIYSPSGGSIGIGFAIPANMAKNVVDQLVKYHHARRGWLGVRVQQVTPDIAESLNLPHPDRPEGALVAGVNDNSPAQKGGLQNGDVILKFNGEDVKEMRNLPRLVAEAPIGKSVPVEVWRGGKDHTLPVTVAEMPDEVKQANVTAPVRPAPPSPAELPGLGLKLSSLDEQARSKFQIGSDQKGVVITDVAGNSTAASRGLRPGDVIVEVQQHAVNSPTEVQQQVDAVRRQDRKSVLMLVQGQDGLRWIPLPLEADAPKPQGPEQKKG